MTIREMIKKFKLTKTERNGEAAIRIGTTRKPTAKQIQMLKDNKAEILAELEIIAAERAAERKAKEEEYLAKADTRRCLVVWQDEYMNTTYSIVTLAYNEERDRYFEMMYGNPKHIGLAHDTETMQAIRNQDCKQYGLGGVAWEITEEQESQIVAEQELAKEEAEATAKVEAEKKAETQAAKEAEREAKFTRAKIIGKPVELMKETQDCDGSVCECSTDIVTWYAMPDGSTQVKRIHTH